MIDNTLGVVVVVVSWQPGSSGGSSGSNSHGSVVVVVDDVEVVVEVVVVSWQPGSSGGSSGSNSHGSVVVVDDVQFSGWLTVALSVNAWLSDHLPAMLKVTEDTLVGSVSVANALVSSAFNVQDVVVAGGVIVVVPAIGPGALTVSVAVACQSPLSRHTAPVVSDQKSALATPGARNVTPPSTDRARH